MARKTTNLPAFDVNSLYGQRPLSRGVVLRGMRSIERELNDQFRSEMSQRAEIDGQLQAAYAPMVERWRETVDEKALRKARAASLRLRKVPVNPPDPPPATRRVFPGSIAATVTPPFNYQWTWFGQSGSPHVDALSANAASGSMEVALATAGYGASSLSGRAAVGIFFAPAVEYGVVRVWANPALSFRWNDWGFWGWAHSEGFVGLYVASYRRNGAFSSTVVNQQIPLWNDTAYGWVHNGQGSTSGFPLFATFDVDRSHVYAIWVWCGARVSSPYGAGDWISNDAYQRLSVRVPAITWELF